MPEDIVKLLLIKEEDEKMNQVEKQNELEAYKELYYDEFLKSIKPQSYDWYLYHSRKNEDNLFYTVCATPLFYLFAGGGFANSIAWTIGLWIFYAILCFINNTKLENDEVILRRRDLSFKMWLQCRYGIII